jgi:Flp pilus assembly protein protease CpaA
MLAMWAPFVFVLGVLVYVSVLDFKTRTVSNWIWVLAYPVGCILTGVGVVFNLVGVGVVLVSFLCSLFLGLGLLYSGFYGGADAKALIFIGLTVPAVPFTFNPASGIAGLPVVLVVFCTSAILSLSWPLSIFILNLKDHFERKTLFEGINLTLRQKLWVLFTSRRIPLDKLGVRYFPAETASVVPEEDNKPVKKLLHWVKAETELQKYIDNLQKHSELYPNGVLASPTIPTLVFFTLALAIAPLGNLLFFL